MSGWRLFPIFLIVMFTLLFFVQYFFYTKVTRHLKTGRKPVWMRTVTNILFAMFNIPLIVLLIWRPYFSHFPEWFLYAGVYPFYVWHFSLLILLLIYLLLKIIQSPVALFVWIAGKKRNQNKSSGDHHAASDNAAYNSSRRVMLRQGFALLTGATFAASGYGAIRRHHYEITSVEIPIKNLPEEFKGFTIALASDIHSSPFMSKERMQNYATAINSLGADLIAVPGDFVNSSLDEVYPFAEAFSQLSAPYGVYGVLGNHDYFTRKVEKVAGEINACGIKLLRNERVIIQKGDQQIYLLGINDTGNRNLALKYVDDAMSHGEEEIPKILLCHRPYFFKSFAVKNVDLTLSGHTHGGQVIFMQLGNNIITPARMASPYVSGVYTEGQSTMYVSRGIGTVGVPIRFNCPPEITKITLVRA